MRHASIDVMQTLASRTRSQAGAVAPLRAPRCPGCSRGSERSALQWSRAVSEPSLVRSRAWSGADRVTCPAPAGLRAARLQSSGPAGGSDYDRFFSVYLSRTCVISLAPVLISALGCFVTYPSPTQGDDALSPLSSRKFMRAPDHRERLLFSSTSWLLHLVFSGTSRARH